MSLADHPVQPGRVGYVVLRTDDEVVDFAQGGLRIRPHYVVLRDCPHCGEESRVTVPAQGLWDWEHGEHAQVAFRDLSTTEREQVMTGFHPACWDEAFPEDEE